jgi:hypothetical protein
MGRKKSNIHYIYKTTCLITNRYYIGMHSTSDLNDGYLGSGRRLRYSIRKYGEENHSKEILEYCTTREELILRETEIVSDELINDEMCMNLRKGGTGGFSVEQQKINASRSNQRQKELMLDDFWVNKKRERISVSVKKAYDEGRKKKVVNYDWLGKKHSEETKRLLSESKKGSGVGESNTQYGTCWITKDGVNKKIKKEELNTWISDGWLKGRVV